MTAQPETSADDHNDAMRALTGLLGRPPFGADAPRKITGAWRPQVEVWCDRQPRCCLGRIYHTPAGNLWAVHTHPPEAAQATWYAVLLDHPDRSPRRVEPLWLTCRHGIPGTGLLDPDEVRALLGEVLAGRIRRPAALVIQRHNGVLASA